jgi:hypothetical protein
MTIYGIRLVDRLDFESRCLGRFQCSARPRLAGLSWTAGHCHCLGRWR